MAVILFDIFKLLINIGILINKTIDKIESYFKVRESLRI